MKLTKYKKVIYEYVYVIRQQHMGQILINLWYGKKARKVGIETSEYR